MYLWSKSEKVNITTEFCIFKLEENNYIFLAGGDALVYLAEPMHKTCLTTFVWGHPFSRYVRMYVRVYVCVCVWACVCVYFLPP